MCAPLLGHGGLVRTFTLVFLGQVGDAVGTSGLFLTISSKLEFQAVARKCQASYSLPYESSPHYMGDLCAL